MTEILSQLGLALIVFGIVTVIVAVLYWLSGVKDR